MVQMAESMKYPIQLVNKQQHILLNVSFGFPIKNNCGENDVMICTMATMVSPSVGIDYNKNWWNRYQQEEPAKIVGHIYN